MEQKDTDIKVGDIVKFGNVYMGIKNLYGSLGLLSNNYSFFLDADKKMKLWCFEFVIDKHGTKVDFRSPNSFTVLTEEQVANINLTDYFSENDLKQYRGNRDEEPLKPSNIKFGDKDIMKSFLRGCKGKGIMEQAAKNPDALSYQVGGNHYKDKAIQPVQYIQANHLSFLEGCIVKRITRHRDKLKALDICKARQECDLILQLEYGTTFDEVMRQQEKSTKGE